MNESNFWNDKYSQIEYFMKMDNFNNFLNWPPIIQCMFINYDTFTKYWIKDIVEPRWKKLLDIESNKGSPSRSQHYNCSDNQIAQVYHLMNLVQKTNCDISKISNIVEIGAGYGLLAKNIYNDGFNGKYHIFDKPVMQVLQKFYLENLPINFIDIDFLSQKLDNCLLIANWSLSEMTIDLREKIITSPLFKSCSHYLICFQKSFENNDNVTYFSKYFSKIENIPYLPENYRIII